MITYKNTTSTFGFLEDGESVDMAVYLTGNSEDYTGILSFNESVATVYNQNDLVIDNETGARVTSEFDTVIVLSQDAVMSNVIANVIYSMSGDEIVSLYNEGYLDFEAVMIYSSGEYVTTSDNVVYQTSVAEE